jgi:predicted RNA-binding protein YlxR (DUF448 family)
MTASPQHAELDNGPHSRERERMCVLTREVRPVVDLIRFVIGPDGAAVPDLKSKLPGRGVWVTATQQALDKAIKNKALVRGFKRDVRLNVDLPAQTGQLLERAALDALAMAGKAGLVAHGFGKTEAALADEDEKVVGLIHGAEAAPDGVRKLGAVLKRRDSGDQVAVITSLTTAQLDLALGRPNVVHAALLAGPASETFLARLRRLERFRSGEQGV